MIPLSCSNCWHNPLQYDSVGLTVGFCTLHKRVLFDADQLTCGHQKRKDLPLASAMEARKHHEKQFSPDEIVFIVSKKKANGSASAAQTDVDELNKDEVGQVVSEWSAGAKIESLSQLKAMKGARADLAWTSLSRAYVSWCQKQKRGHWTSGIHLLRWALQRLDEEPAVQVADLRTSAHVSLARQVELAQWSLVMLRLCFISDMGAYVKPFADPVGKLDGFVETAAEESGELALKPLVKWLKNGGRSRAQKALPFKRYRELATQLHKRRGEEGED